MQFLVVAARIIVELSLFNIFDEIWKSQIYASDENGRGLIWNF